MGQINLYINVELRSIISHQWIGQDQEKTNTSSDVFQYHFVDDIILVGSEKSSGWSVLDSGSSFLVIGTRR